MINKLSKEERFSIAQFILRYTVGEVPYMKALECLDILEKHLALPDKEKFISDHSKTDKDLCIQLILLLAKNFPDDQMRVLMKEYDDFSRKAKEPDAFVPTPGKITEQEIIEIDFSDANKAFLKKSLEQAIPKVSDLYKTTYPDNYIFLKQICKKCGINTGGKFILMSCRECVTLQGYLKSCIEQTKHRRYRSMLEIINVAMAKFEKENDLQPGP